MGLFSWLEGPPPRTPLPGETFRFSRTNQEVLILHVQPEDRLIGEPNRFLQQEFLPAYVRYRAKSGDEFEAPYRQFIAGGAVVAATDSVAPSPLRKQPKQPKHSLRLIVAEPGSTDA